LWQPRIPDDSLPTPAFTFKQMVDMQLTYEAMKIPGFDVEAMPAVAADFAFLQELAHVGKVAQGRFIARRDWVSLAEACLKGGVSRGTLRMFRRLVRHGHKTMTVRGQDLGRAFEYRRYSTGGAV